MKHTRGNTCDSSEEHFATRCNELQDSGRQKGGFFYPWHPSWRFGLKFQNLLLQWWILNGLELYLEYFSCSRWVSFEKDSRSASWGKAVSVRFFATKGICNVNSNLSVTRTSLRVEKKRSKGGCLLKYSYLNLVIESLCRQRGGRRPPSWLYERRKLNKGDQRKWRSTLCVEWRYQRKPHA